ncbi:MAG TPA: DUF2252 family protein [Caulobacteraceae bacterium]|jgi:hypothetical protein
MDLPALRFQTVARRRILIAAKGRAGMGKSIARGEMTDFPDIVAATASYEAWLGKQVDLVKSDLKLKHARMADDQFQFFRATFYRWMQLWPRLCPELDAAPRLVAVGDLHIENFGTWRDAEGRLIWGVNDYDEAHPLPYTQDLVRLAASALLAARTGGLSIDPELICAAILKGYGKGLSAGGRPFVLGADFVWLREIAIADLRDPTRFAARMAALAKPRYRVPKKVEKALAQQMPEAGLDIIHRHRVAGLGSLGRRRVVALADWRGGIVVREAKPMIPSACVWAQGRPQDAEVFYRAVTDRPDRCPDPWLTVQDGWVIRRLAADSSAIEMARLPRGAERRLLTAMGRETANVHQTGDCKAVRADLKARPKHWLQDAAHRMLKALEADWVAWRERD